MIKVLVIDPTRLFREGIRTLIHQEPDIQVIDTTEDIPTAIAIVTIEQPHVVLIDADMPKLEAIKACAEIKEISPDTHVVFLTENNSLELIFRAIANGAEGYLLKQLYPDMLIQAIRDAARGQYILSGDVAKTIIKQVQKLTMDVGQILTRRLENKGITLTNREKDIIGLLYKGYTNQQISKEIHLSEGTVKNYISEIYVKIGINNREKVISYLENLLHI